MDLHEWGDEKDCFTKEDLTTLRVWFYLVVKLVLNFYFSPGNIRSRTLKVDSGLQLVSESLKKVVRLRDIEFF